MPTVLEHRRDNTTNRLVFTPAQGELFVDTVTYGTYIGDGVTVGGIQINGNRKNAQTGTTYNVSAQDDGKYVTFSNVGAIAVTLFQAGSVSGTYFPDQTGFWALNIGAGTVTITPTTSTINGAATLTLATGDGARIWSDGANYFAAKGTALAATTLAGLTDVAITTPADDDFLVYVTGTGKWTNHRQHYDISPSSPQTVAYTASQVVMAHRYSKAITIPANFGAYLGRTSQAGGSANATGSTVFNVDKAASATPNTFSNVGTITFAAGTVTPTFASSGSAAISFAQGDVLRVVAPASPDTTFAGFYCTLVGFET